MTANLHYLTRRKTRELSVPRYEIDQFKQYGWCDRCDQLSAMLDPRSILCPQCHASR